MFDKIKYVLASSWVVTLTATLIGVLLALFLNEWALERRVMAQKAIALKNIEVELTQNNDRLIEAIEQHRRFLEIIAFIGPNLNVETGELIAASSVMSRFQAKFPGVITLLDSVRVDGSEEELYDYDGEVDFDLSAPQVELNTIAWETLQATGISTEFNFSCLLYLAETYKVTEEIKNLNRELLDFFNGKRPVGEQYTNLLVHLQTMISFEESLNESITGQEKVINGVCEQ